MKTALVYVHLWTLLPPFSASAKLLGRVLKMVIKVYLHQDPSALPHFTRVLVCLRTSTVSTHWTVGQLSRYITLP